MKRFLKHALLFLLPVVLVAAFFGVLLVRTGELRDLDELCAGLASGQLEALELGYTVGDSYIKNTITSQKTGLDVLALGTSRVMQFRAQFFPEANFYNAGGAINRLQQALPFLAQLPKSARPKVVILGLDQYFFNVHWDPCAATDESYITYKPAPSPDAYLRLLRDFGNAKYSPFQVFTAPAGRVGLPCKVRGSGFLPDGSYRYGTQADAPDLTFADSRNRIHYGNNRFQYGDEVNPTALAVLEELLAWCAGEGIQVVGFLPPYAPSIAALMAEDGRYGYLQALPAAVRQVFDSYGMACYDFTQMDDTADEEYVDGFHGGDRVYAKLTLHMVESGSALAAYTTPQHIQALLAAPGNPRVLELG